MNSNGTLRAIVGARVSHVQGPQKVSHIAQHATGNKWADDNGAAVVGTFQDLDVSASVSPFERPDLGQWFKEENAHAWDVMVFSKVDRAFRSIADSVDAAKWFRDNGKMLVFAEDGLKLDYRPGTASASFEGMMAELFIFLGAFFGQLELARFKSRAKDAHSVLRQTDRWASGVPPLGFKTIGHPSGKGKTLDTDPEGKALLYDMAGKLISGWSYTRIANHYNETGVRTGLQKARLANGKKIKENPWTVFTVREAMTSLKTQGYKITTRGTKKGEPVLTPTGEMIRLAPATFDDATWAQIQEAVAKRAIAPRSKTVAHNKYLGVGYCKCGASLTQKFDKRVRASGKVGDLHYYLCGRSPKTCRGTLIRAEALDAIVEKLFLITFGDTEVTTRVFVPGEDYSHDLEMVKATIARLRRESDAGLIVSEADEAEYMQRMAALVARRTDLEAKPSRPAGWVNKGLGKTYREVWTEPSTDRQQVLKDAGVKFYLTSAKPLVMEIEFAKPDPNIGRSRTALHETFEAMTRNGVAAVDFTGADQMPKPIMGHTWHQPMEGAWVLTSDAIMAQLEARELKREEQLSEEWDWDGE
ncbi:recombinase family protein [Nocardia arthritidis]|uniref:Recombinase family protein n=1 Tax=Nocardia arthritidis TaxID=228602 RepID=A0A6G9Y4R1_9NOCA|nr:recombinase family protein [Nocardia arthritidis]QIS08218.1 recombinase family protein [Nocardia arthritidis]